MNHRSTPRDGDRLTECLAASGHENVTGTHETTFEITTDEFLTPAGDCIIGIGADRAPADFDAEFVAACRDADAVITVTVTVTGDTDREPTAVTVSGRGDPRLSFESDRGAVIRTSEYVDERTVAVEADTAAADLDRSLIAALAGGADLRVVLAVDPPE